MVSYSWDGLSVLPKEGLFVKKRSSVLLSLVGSVCYCVRPWSFVISSSSQWSVCSFAWGMSAFISVALKSPMATEIMWHAEYIILTGMLNMVKIGLKLTKLQSEVALFGNVISNFTWFYLNTPVYINTLTHPYTYTYILIHTWQCISKLILAEKARTLHKCAV